ncbi:hypothetical protein GLP30_02125 [Photobacterium phosphoreum]|uniref:Restriction endonuclease n=1 Tax=Photobacterium phosphoreum TaxID=659 RepID=A0AAW4ZTX3_PHOPO|nr:MULTISPECIES: hypothetical protein [Photobacterium]MCD9489399.1 hypothetical protein [Photobacterium phosphoreum]MCF2188891.1 hypothetical protein [Photobacterium phosphoreum]MCF2300534.1 hypothetical protein [Photobacterium phosphoreum]MEC6880883.1 hypothetical protein [Photobacterium piscicola]
MEPTDLERLIHESLEQLGWTADAEALAKKVKRLDIGLPLEDEFSVLCGWLGQCKLIHKLDQQQYPIFSKDEFQVPDLFATFNLDGKNVPVLIEVKSSLKNVLSFTPQYIGKLKAYSNLLNLPILIAWKNKFGIWTLNSLDSFQQAKKNYNLNINDSMCNSLMGHLVGDFAYSLGAGAGVHIQAKKTKLVDVEVVKKDTQWHENWETVIDDVYFTSYDGEKFRDLSTLAQQVFYAWDLSEETTVTDSHLTFHNVCQESSILFAQMALTRVLAFRSSFSEQQVRWRSVLGGNKILDSLADFRNGIIENMDKKIVHHIIDPIPKIMPKFLN